MYVEIVKSGKGGGRSFKGAAMYLLHDKDGASTSERVAYTETRNLATNNPDAAWRVMAMTAMDRDRLKAKAGVSTAGRKPGGPVTHMFLSWHPDDAENLSVEEMRRAALGAIRAIGAEDRQALLVVHSDEEHPHIHVLLNRVSPTNGKMLPSSNDRLKLSRFAEKYERDGGRIYSENRVINNARRDRGEYVKGTPKKPRHIHELEAASAEHPDAKQISAEQKTQDLALARKTRALRLRHRKQLDQFDRDHLSVQARTRAEAKIDAAKAREHVRDRFQPAWTARFHEAQAELRDFERRENRLLGRVQNTLRAINFRALVGAGDRGRAMKDAYNAISSSGGRLEVVKRAQESKDRELGRRQKTDERRAVAGVRSARDRKLAEQRAMFTAERAALLFKHQKEWSGNRAEWRTRAEHRRGAWAQNRSPDNSEQDDPKRGPAAESYYRDLADSFGRRDRGDEQKAKDAGTRDPNERDGHSR